MSAIDNARADVDPKVRIYVNSNSHMSRGKYAAAAVHAALTAAGVHPGLPVIVLGAQRDHAAKHSTVIYDAGRTEVEPGTPTAGTSWAPDTAVTDAERRRVMEDMLRFRLLPNEVIEYLNGYLEAMDEDTANHTDGSAP